jgi:hypothetical protein
MSRDLLGALWLVVDDLGDAPTFDRYRVKFWLLIEHRIPRSSARIARLMCDLDRMNGGWG